MITAIANFHANPGNGDRLAALIPAHAAATRAEPGCRLFSAYRATEDPDDFVFVEQYADRDAFESHRHSDHFIRHVREGMVPLLDRRIVGEYEEVAAPDLVGAHAERKEHNDEYHR